MLYTSDYFDNCNGLIPQIVLSACTLEAANWKTRDRQFPQVDVSELIKIRLNYNVSNNYGSLIIEGLLPIQESSYLIDRQDIVERIDALNEFDTGGINQTIGLPFISSDTSNLKPVVLPPNIPNLSKNELVLEKRLAWLLLENLKRSNLYLLHNYLHLTKISATITPLIYNTSNNTYTFGSPSLYLPVIAIRLKLLITKYSRLNELINFPPDSEASLEFYSNWLKDRLEEDYLIFIPKIDIDELIEAGSELVEDARDYRKSLRSANTIEGTILASDDVSAYIDSSSSVARSDLDSPEFDNPPSFDNSNNNSINDNPIESNLPDRDYTAYNEDRITNTLPEC